MWDENPSNFKEQPWSEWTDFLENKSPTEENESQCMYQPPTSAVKLKKEGMKLFGFHLERDGFSTVVCETCQKVVKPQVLQSHFEARHSKGSTPKSPLTKPVPAAVKSSSAKVRLKKSSVVISKADSTSVAAPVNTNNNTATVKCNVSIMDAAVVSSSAGNGNIVTPTRDLLTPSNTSSAVESEPTIDNLENYDNPMSSGSSNVSALASQFENGAEVANTNSAQNTTDVEPLTSSVFPSTVSMAVSLPLNNIPSLINVPPATGAVPKGRGARKVRSVKEKEYDADRNCGVIINDMPCKRSLTCSLHSMQMRRAVEGRTKTFDQLLAEHRATKDPTFMLKKNESTLNSSNNTATISVKVDNATVGNSTSRSGKSIPVYEASSGISSISGGSITTDNGLRVSESVSLMNPNLAVQPMAVEECSSEIVTPSQSDITTDNSSLTSPPSIVILNRTQILSRPTHVTLSSFSNVVDFNETPTPPPPADVSTVLDIVFTSAHPKPLAVGGMFNNRKIGGLVYCHRKIGMARHFLSDLKDI